MERKREMLRVGKLKKKKIEARGCMGKDPKEGQSRKETAKRPSGKRKLLLFS
jgi:hypothetical protein